MAFRLMDEAELIQRCRRHWNDFNPDSERRNILFLGDGTLVKIGDEAHVDAAWLKYLEDIPLPPTIKIPRLIQPAVEDEFRHQIFYYTRMEHIVGETIQQHVDRNNGRMDPIVAQRYMQANRELSAAVHKKAPFGLQDAVPGLHEPTALNGLLFPFDFEGAWYVQTMDDVRDAIEDLRTRCEAAPLPSTLPWEFTQGDVSPHNAIITPEAIALVDFTWAGYRPAGYDLWTLKRSAVNYPMAFKSAMIRAYEDGGALLDSTVDKTLTKMAGYFWTNGCCMRMGAFQARFADEIAEFNRLFQKPEQDSPTDLKEAAEKSTDKVVEINTLPTLDIDLQSAKEASSKNATEHDAAAGQFREDQQALKTEKHEAAESGSQRGPNPEHQPGFNLEMAKGVGGAVWQLPNAEAKKTQDVHAHEATVTNPIQALRIGQDVTAVF